MERIEKRTKFTVSGAEYEHANPHPEQAAESVCRFSVGAEPEDVAQVHLADGGTVEVHGYATHYNRECVTPVWNNDHVQHFDCRTLAADVRLADEGQLRGRYVALHGSCGKGFPG